VFHSRTKHIDIKYHFLREKIDNGELDVEYISTDEMLADSFTKNLQRIKHDKFVNDAKMNVVVRDA
jgi:hypothetical protein